MSPFLEFEDDFKIYAKKTGLWNRLTDLPYGAENLPLAEEGLGDLKFAVDRSLRHLLLGKTTALQGWQALRDHFNNQAALEQMPLFRAIFRASICSETPTIAKMFSVIRTNTLKLESLGVKVPEQLVCLSVIDNLPSTYKTVTTVFAAQAKGAGGMRVQDLEATLAVDERRQLDDQKKHSVQALAARFEQMKSGASSGPGGSGSGGGNYKGIKCNYCGIPGHIKRDCRKFARDRPQGAGGAAAGAAAGGGAAGGGGGFGGRPRKIGCAVLLRPQVGCVQQKATHTVEEEQRAQQAQEQQTAGGAPSAQQQKTAGGAPSAQQQQTAGGAPSAQQQKTAGGAPSAQQQKTAGGAPSAQQQQQQQCQTAGGGILSEAGHMKHFAAAAALRLRYRIDSGADVSMTDELGDLVDYKPLSAAEAPEVQGVGGGVCRAAGVGPLVLYSPHYNTEVRVNGVYYFPGCGFKLLSPQCMMRNNPDLRVAMYGSTSLVQYKNQYGIGLHQFRWEIAMRADLSPVDGRQYLESAPRRLQKQLQSLAVLEQSAELWHRRFGHLSYQTLARLASSGMVGGMDTSAGAFRAAQKVTCDTCATANADTPAFPARQPDAVRVLQRVHMDVCGPMRVAGYNSDRYFCTFLCEGSGFSTVRTSPDKEQIPRIVVDTLTKWEQMTGQRVREIQTDRGREYKNSIIAEFTAQRGITHNTSAPRTPQQNGRAERLNRTLLRLTRSLLQDSGVKAQLWPEALITANDIRNRSPYQQRDKTPWELFTGTKPDVSRFRIFGCRAYVQRPDEQRHKLESRGEPGIFVGYARDSDAYRVLLDSGKIVESAKVVFAESGVKIAVPSSPEYDYEQVGVEGEGASDTGEHAAAGENDSPAAVPRRSPRLQANAVTQDRTVEGIVVPTNRKQALESPQADSWLAAERKEIAAHASMATWSLARLPEGKKCVGGRWVYDVKVDEDGNLKFKARWVAQGFSQQEGLDYTDVFAPASNGTSRRVFMALTASRKMKVRQVDVGTAFLHAPLEEEIYMRQPDGYETGESGMVCKLEKALYGLKQGARAWYFTLKQELEGMGFKESDADPTLFARGEGAKRVYVLAHVDDLQIASCIDGEVDAVVSALGKVFKLREVNDASLFLGVEVDYDRNAGRLKLHQGRYTRELLARFGMEKANPCRIPMDPGTVLVGEGADKTPMADAGKYRELVGSLMYLASNTRPDIVQPVYLLARFMQAPTAAQWEAAKKVLRYLRGTTDMGIEYGGGDETLTGYSDADWGGDKATMRSTTGYGFVLNGGVVSYKSKLQPTVATSSGEAEYMAAAHTTREAVWLRRLLAFFKGAEELVPIWGDNQGALALIKNHIISERSKHIDIMHHFVRERVKMGQVSFSYKPTAEMLADMLTKALPYEKFVKFRMEMGVR